MAWLQIHTRLSSSDYSAVETLLEDLGALSLTLMDALDQPIFEPPLGSEPLWNEIKVSALFDADTDPFLIHAALQGLNEVSLHEWRDERLEDDDWERKWMARFKPMQFGSNLWIVPSWHEAPDPDAVNISLDPGLAFGSGTHETTALCLQWLSEQTLNECDVLDFGCGSGILAIAALKLGAKRADGIDIDPQAITASRNNAEKNGIDLDDFSLHLADDLPSEPYDVVVANILSVPLIELSETLATFCRAGGRIALSGILREQATSVSEAYAPWFTMSEPEFRGDWTRLTGTRNDRAAQRSH
ncbi:unnamed protein product [Cyprideis torosa]|uniref:ETFB lysine methyltransferase n=1 Tax=Cyprideis torosa TaxID=163714 RepID=A0A7R8ZTK6_9CRUS|nr:unnamed protein product [Cyprideis torosa]CAG0907737.1 unnamed protein product [Cyprideis torosa]